MVASGLLTDVACDLVTSSPASRVATEALRPSSRTSLSVSSFGDRMNSGLASSLSWANIFGTSSIHLPVGQLLHQVLAFC